jgi:hypothetical protein
MTSSCRCIAWSPRRRLSSGEARAELPVLLYLFCAPASELWCTGAAGGRTPMSALPRSSALGPCHRRSMVDRVLLGRFTTCGPGPRLYPLKNNSLFRVFRTFCTLLIDCFVIGNIALKPLFEDFQDQTFEESQLFFADQQDNSP